ncbi:MAG TPA: B12-binding domain-containing radical SAM protein, partial [Syntrophobacteraceae bacterium]|nr:B12-binding domain-containing radical SAM protein [Syntrophobacteraceae bacterium]
FQRQVDFVQKSGVVTAMIGLLTAIPGTRLYKRLEQEGRLLFKPSGNNTDVSGS